MRIEAPFTWFANYTKQLDMMQTEAQQARFAVGVARYGTYGIEPDFEDDLLLKMAFEGIRINVENSRESYLSGKRGGRPKKQKPPLETPLSNPPKNHGGKPIGEYRKGKDSKGNGGSGAAVAEATPRPAPKYPRCKECGSIVSPLSDGSGFYVCVNCKREDLTLGELA